MGGSVRKLTKIAGVVLAPVTGGLSLAATAGAEAANKKDTIKKQAVQAQQKAQDQANIAETERQKRLQLLQYGNYGKSNNNIGQQAPIKTLLGQ